jgi:tRNA(Arg) A34 adenosine deaminase TadA
MFSHAELVAIEDASKGNLYGALKGTTMYCSCEPCAMCMGAIIYEEIGKLFYACTLEDSNEFVVEEVKVGGKQIAELAGSEIEIIPEFEREKALEVMKKYKE